MSNTGIAIGALIMVHVGMVAALGRFLTLLDRDDPETFSTVATPEEIHLGQSGFYFLGPMKFLLFHIIPKGYEDWGLSAATRSYADRLRWGSMLGVTANVAIFFYVLFSIT